MMDNNVPFIKQTPKYDKDEVIKKSQQALQDAKKYIDDDTGWKLVTKYKKNGLGILLPFLNYTLFVVTRWSHRQDNLRPNLRIIDLYL
jgi:hypothetical protein